MASRKLTLRPEVVALLGAPPTTIQPAPVTAAAPAISVAPQETLGTPEEVNVAKRRSALGVGLEIPTSLEPIAPAQSQEVIEPLSRKLTQRPEVQQLLGITPKKTFVSTEQDIADAARINEQRRRALISRQNRLIRTSTLGAGGFTQQSLGGLNILTGV